ncbi:ABC transporter substrate-binding protein [Algicella marina]|uniref:ABC transporter substrate-binding protein n=1 Tax=Algicella marina TaxID=2683284 RepID=A0A6P1SZH0_9RHOB|nr:ABC transporter substrate-binding protein [Algicella marina]QHQ35137.1 ABC transporter substrate-binding protein [Algicella marina]
MTSEFSRSGATASRRQFIAGAAATLAAPAVFAAGTELRFTHAYGESVLAKPAERVASIGYNTHDTVLALGTVPVGLRYWYGDYPHGVWPWAQDALGDGEPVLMRGEVSMEIIAGLAPDVIVAAGSGISEAEYALLSQIAPVLMQEPQYTTFGSPWQAETRMIGRALGRPDRAEQLIQGLEAAFSDIKARHPDWSGKTAAAAWHASGQTGAFAAEDTRARFLAELGFVPTRKLLELPTIDGFYTTLSPEDLSPIDADLLVWISSLETAPDIAALAMRRTLDAHVEGREVFADQLISGALSFGTILSLPFALAELEEPIALALDGDPATIVPSSQKAGLLP